MAAPVRAGELERVRVLDIQDTRLARALGRVVVNPVVLDLVPLLGCPRDPGWDSLHPLPVCGLQPGFDLRPAVNRAMVMTSDFRKTLNKSCLICWLLFAGWEVALRSACAWACGLWLGVCSHGSTRKQDNF